VAVFYICLIACVNAHPSSIDDVMKGMVEAYRQSREKMNQQLNHLTSSGSPLVFSLYSVIPIVVLAYALH